jgi:N-acetylneuraminic acid mutarotase
MINYNLPPAPMKTARFSFGCVTDSTGNIFVIGGQTAFATAITTVEKYNPTTNTWTSIPSFSVPRFQINKVAIDSRDRIYVIGGVRLRTSADPQTFSDSPYIHETRIEMYDPVTNAWTFHTRTIDNLAWGSNVSYNPSTNEVIVTGGFTYEQNKTIIFDWCHIYNLDTNSFYATTLKLPRFNHGVTVGSNGQLIITGGVTSYIVGQEMVGSRSVEVYSPVTKQCDLTPELMKVGRYNHVPTVNSAGDIFAIGGISQVSDNFTVDWFNHTTGIWTLKGLIPSGKRSSNEYITDSSGKVYMYGSSTEDDLLKKIDVFDSTQNSFNPTLTTKSRRNLAKMAIDENGYLYHLGGYVATINSSGGYDINPSSIVERIRIADSNVVSSGDSTITVPPTIPVPPPLNVARYDFGFATVSNNLIYIIGGKDNSGTELDSVERYDLSKNTWTTLQPLSTPRAGGKAVVDKNNNIYIIGGTTTGSTSSSVNYVLAVERFSNNKWETITQLPIPRNNHEVQINTTTNEIYVFGGTYNYTDKYSISTNTWSQLPFARDNSAGSTIDSDGNLYYFSSESSTTDDAVSFFKFNIVIDKWEFQTKSEDLPFSKFTSVVTKANKIFTIGGLSKSTSISASAKWFDPAIKKWNSAPDIPSGVRSFHSSVVDSNNKIYVIGGGVHRQPTIGNYTNKVVDTVDVLDSNTLTWSTITKLNNPRFGAQSIIFDNDTIFNFGGWTNDGNASAIVERFDSQTNKWYSSTTFTIVTTGNTTSNVITTTSNVLYPIPDLTAPTTNVNPHVTTTTTTPDKQTTNTVVVVSTTGYTPGTSITIPSTITNIYSNTAIVNIPVIVDQSATWGVNQTTSLTNTLDIKIKAFYGLSDFTALNLK